jgi:multidrug efflux system outer membrane protein
MRRLFLPLSLVALLAGCKVGPRYERPAVQPPPQYRAGEAQPSTASFGDTKWFDVFQDDTLRGLIKEAVAANYDVRIAAQRVIEAEGRYASIRGGLFPRLDARGQASRVGLDSPIQSLVGIFGAVSWELDLFGKIRSASDAARADLLATQENQKAVLQSLVAQVANGYFSLRELDAELEYVRESIKTRSESLRLVSARLKGGVTTKLEVDQAQSLVAAAQAELALIEQGIEQTENLINFILGKQPGPVARGQALTAQAHPPQVPAGLPSALLERRPDIRIAEQQLIAANARVGVAKAAFFPSINLTATGGYQSADLFGIIGRNGFSYDMAGIVDLPIFDAGRRAGDYKAAKAQKEQLIINYIRAVNSGFTDVSNSLIGYQKSREYRSSRELFANTLRDQSRLSNLRYRGGVTSYLEVLDTERQRLTAEQQLAQAQRAELAALVQLYKALGGGWQ